MNPNAAPTLEAHELALEKVFSSDFAFSIPDYQRPYSWSTDQSGQLLDDLKDAMDQEDNEPYFLGSVVLVKSKGSPAADVIDGQQRLTTLTILFSALRALASDEKVVNRIESWIHAPIDPFDDAPSQPRIILRNRDQDFFFQYIQSADGPGKLLDRKFLGAAASESQQKIFDNFQHFYTELEAWSEDRRKQIAALLSKRTFLVVVSTPSTESAHRIFSVMNSRGLELSPADIFKSRVIGAISDDAVRQKYSEKWEQAEVDITRSAFADLFLHLRTIFMQERAKSSLLKEFQESVLSQFLPNRAAIFVDEVVVPYAEAYSTVTDASYQGKSRTAEVNAFLKRLNALNNKDWLPPALWAMHHHSEDEIFLAEFFSALERLAASMLIRREYATPRAQRYAELLRHLESGNGLESRALQLNEQEKSATLDFLDGPIYRANPVARYVLQRLDEILAGESGVSYNHKIITVEHVLPQRPGLDSKWRRNFTDDERSTLVNRLGNLVLLNRRKNSQAGNADFVAKKENYFKTTKGVSVFSVTTQVITETDWTAETIRLRQEKLLSLLAKEWALAPLREGPRQAATDGSSLHLWIYGAEGAYGHATYMHGEFIVTEARLLKTTKISMRNSLLAFRDDLISKAVLSDDGPNHFVLREPQTFTSSSAAAMFVLGRSSNGRTEWKSEAGVPLQDLTDMSSPPVR
ncbi:DUF4357 domain-containing protein [Arthrobacter sp. Soil736]|uniref:DUF4357 domain-containing protein n=1 Tax=Arthrobacter sp. Soil736 TaxID=1736395 RepID=UPI0009E78DF3|nr:DUF4357 domain-containing protein [Arthrobacter sp. Soil736]